MSLMGVTARVLAAGSGGALAGAWRRVGRARGGAACCCRPGPARMAAGWLAAGVALAGVRAVAAGWVA